MSVLPLVMSRAWAMPRKDTFAIAPIGNLLDRWLTGREVVIDPFARNSKRGTHRNDLDPAAETEHHLDVIDFAEWLKGEGIAADAILFDPPYSPRQIAEHYRGAGRPVTQKDMQSAFYSDARGALVDILRTGGIAISAGWNSVGFGKKYGFILREMLVVCHGGAHNDTIVIVEEKVGREDQPELPLGSSPLVSSPPGAVR